jgi:hypothetical protein
MLLSHAAATSTRAAFSLVSGRALFTSIQDTFPASACCAQALSAKFHLPSRLCRASTSEELQVQEGFGKGLDLSRRLCIAGGVAMAGPFLSVHRVATAAAYSGESLQEGAQTGAHM